MILAKEGISSQATTIVVNFGSWSLQVHGAISLLMAQGYEDPTVNPKSVNKNVDILNILSHVFQKFLNSRKTCIIIFFFTHFNSLFELLGKKI